MNFSEDVLIGAAMVAFGLYTFIARITAPHQFKKIEAMKEKFGEKWGGIIHVVAYTVIPLVAGVSLLFNSLSG